MANLTKERGYGQNPQELCGEIKQKRTELALRSTERLRAEQKERRKQQGDKAQRGQLCIMHYAFCHCMPSTFLEAG